MVPDTNFFLSHLDVFELSLATAGCWSIVISNSVITQLTEISTYDTKIGKAGQEALRAIYSAIDNKLSVTISTSEDANVTNLAMFSEEQEDQLAFAGRTSLDDATIDVVKQHELSKREDLYRLGADPETYALRPTLTVLFQSLRPISGVSFQIRSNLKWRPKSTAASLSVE